MSCRTAATAVLLTAALLATAGCRRAEPASASAGRAASGRPDRPDIVLVLDAVSFDAAPGEVEVLITRGILSERLITVGMGELRPVADNNTAAGRQANRRVEITMVPVTAG